MIRPLIVLLTGLGLSFKLAPSGSPLGGPVIVPVDSEDDWIAQFKTSAIVKSTSRIVMVIVP